MWYGSVSLVANTWPRLVFYGGLIHCAILGYTMLTLYNYWREVRCPPTPCPPPLRTPSSTVPSSPSAPRHPNPAVAGTADVGWAARHACPTPDLLCVAPRRVAMPTGCRLWGCGNT